MAMLCSVCNNAQVEEINKEIISGTPIRRIAARFGLSASAVARHKKKHLPETLLQAREAAEVAHADDLLAQVQELQAVRRCGFYSRLRGRETLRLPFQG